MNVKFDKEQLDEMCNKIDLFEYASQTYEFKQNSSDSWVCHCPLHKDNTPSLSISRKNNLFYCFSCSTSGNIITWMMKIEKLSFPEAISKLAKLTNTSVKQLKTCETLAYFKEVKQALSRHRKKNINREILSESYWNSFSDEIPQEWVDEGISPEAIRLFDVKIDNRANRIVYKVYDNDFNFIGVKGRTRFDDYKLLGISKYMNYQKIQGTDFFMGMKQNKSNILQSNSVIIFEGIKSVMKAYDYGYYNTIAAETSCLNDEQVMILIRLGVKDVTIAFDSDVSYDKIKKCTGKLRKFTNVYYTQPCDLLGEKEAPVDRGKDIFDQILKRRMRV